MNGLGERIKIVRGNASQSEFSTKIGVSQNALSRYERGVNSPDAESLIKICSTCGIEVKWLIFGEGPMYLGGISPLSEPAPLRQVPVAETSDCVLCAKITAKVEKVEQQRDDLMQESRELNAENRRLLKENGDLRERCAKLEERQIRCGQPKMMDTTYIESA